MVSRFVQSLAGHRLNSCVAITSSPNPKTLRREISEALDRLYMGDCTFLPVFDETPLQAVAAFRKAPEVFGVLRSYVGRATLQASKMKVLRLARSLMALNAAAIDAKTVRK